MDSPSKELVPRARAARGVEHWLILAGALAPLVALVVLGLFVEPDPRGHSTHEKLGLPACYPMKHWNVPCPGCGVTTSMALAARGEVWSAFVNQPFGLLCALAAPVLAAWAFVHHLRGRDLNATLQAVRFGRLGLVVGLLMSASWLYKIALVRGWLA